MTASPKKEVSAEDVALLYSRSEDGQSYGVLRRRKDEIQVGTLRALEEGKPIHGEVVTLRQRADSSVLFDVETEHAVAPMRKPSGPARITTREYRKGWDSIWSAKSGSCALN